MKIQIGNDAFEMLQNGSSYKNTNSVTLRILSSDPTFVDMVFSSNHYFTIIFDDESETSIEYKDVHCVYLYHNQELGIIYDSEKDKYITQYGDIITISLLK